MSAILGFELMFSVQEFEVVSVDVATLLIKLSERFIYPQSTPSHILSRSGTQS